MLVIKLFLHIAQKPEVLEVSNVGLKPFIKKTLVHERSQIELINFIIPECIFPNIVIWTLEWW